jgi:hypothetical protein
VKVAISPVERQKCVGIMATGACLTAQTRTVQYDAAQYGALRRTEGSMARSTTSLRLDDALRARLAAMAAAEGVSVTTLVERLLREGLAVAEHPGIVFQTGPAGRRAALAGGPDVWEIAAALRHTAGAESERVAALAAEFGIRDRQVVIALNYAAAHREEIDARVRANDGALEEAERVARERKRLLA